MDNEFQIINEDNSFTEEMNQERKDTEDITNAINEVCSNEISYDEQCKNDYVSALTISRIRNAKENTFENMLDEYDKYLTTQAQYYISSRCRITIDDFDYKTNELIIYFNEKSTYGDNKEIRIGQKDGKIFISKFETYYAPKVFNLLRGELEAIYNNLKELCVYKNNNELKNGIPSINSKFGVNADQYSTQIFYNDDKNAALNSKLHLYRTNIYFCCTESNEIKKMSEAKAYQLYKNINVKVSDCPEWLQNEIHSEREKCQMVEEKVKEEKEKKAKRLALRKKILHF